MNIGSTQFLNSGPDVCKFCGAPSEPGLIAVCKSCDDRLEVFCASPVINPPKKTSWLDQVPPKYRESNLEQFPEQAWQKIQSWEPGENLWIASTSGKCKTRMAVQLMRLAYQRGLSVGFISAVQMGEAWRFRFEDRKAYFRVQEILHREFLVLDDLGKGRLSSSVQECWHHLLEHRTSWELSTILTTNILTLEDYAAEIDQMYLESSLRRIREYFRAVRV